MDLQEQRLTCLRMALEMGCKADTVVSVATDLLDFLSGGSPTAAHSPAEEKSEEVIAACGTALAASEAADLVAQAAEPAATADTPAAAGTSAEAALEPPATPTEVVAAPEMPAAAAAEVEVTVEPTPQETAAGTPVGTQSGEPSASEKSLTEPALAAEAGKVADEDQVSTQPTEVAAASNGVGQEKTAGTAVTAA